MASLQVLAFDHGDRPVQFDTWLDDLQMYLLGDSKDSVSLFDLASGAATAPPATANSSTRSQWLTRDAAARLAIRNHLPLAECAHFGQHRTAQALYDAVVARYSSPATATLGRLLLPYLFLELSAFATIEDLLSYLCASDARYRAAVPAQFLDRNPPPMYITLYFIVTRLPDSLRSVRDHFLSLDPTSLIVDLLEQHLLAAETSALAVDVSVPEDVGAASASAKPRISKGKGDRGGGGGSGGGRGGSGSGRGGSNGGGGGGGTGGGSGGSGGGSGGSGGGSGFSGGGGGGSGESGGSGGGGTGSGGTGARRVGSGGGQRQQQQRRSEILSPQQLHSPQQNGIAERRIGLVMKVARTSMIHAAAPHFLWPFAVGDASVFRVLGSRAFVRDTSADKLSPRAIPCDVTFDETVPFYRLFPYRSAPTPPPPPPLFLAPGPPPVDPLPPQGPAPSGVSQVDPLPGPSPVRVAVDSSAAQGAASGGAASGGAEPGGAESEGAETGGAKPRGVAPGGGEPGGAEPEGVEPGGSASEGAESGDFLRSGASGAGGAGTAGAGGPRVAARTGVTEGTATTSPGGARTRGTEAAGTGGVEGAGVGDLTEFGTTGAGGAGAGVGSRGAGDAGVGGPSVGGAGAGGAGAVDRTLFPCSSRFLPASPLPAPSPYTEHSGGLTERREPLSRPVLPIRTAHHDPRSLPPPVPGMHAMTLRPSSVPLRVPLLATHESSLPEVPDPESDRTRTASPAVSRLLAIAITDPSFESAAASALVAELLDFAAACHLDYATALAAESASTSPPSVGGECALGTDVLEDKQEHFESLAAAVPRFASMLLAPEGEPDAPDVPTPRSYAEAITGPSALWLPVLLATAHSSTSHSLSALPSDESIEPSGPYPELVGCLMYLMTCTRPDLAYPLSLFACYVAPGRHQKVHWDAAKRVVRYFCSMSGMGLVLGGRGPVVLTGHADASWVDDSATQQSSQG
ncbi:unnamed protein product [Closterium sp. NIES-54]